MAKRRRIIPFSWRNVLLGLEGKSKLVAEAEYLYTGEELERQLVEIKESDEKAKLLAELELDFKYKKISELEYDKAKANIKEEPWVHGSIRPEPGRPLSGYFDLDWNEFFIKELENNGYIGKNEEEIINNWLVALHTNQLFESGVSDIGEGLERTRGAQRKELKGGKAEYS